MSEPDRLARLLRRVALGLVVLLLAVSTLSAFLRVSRAGLGCADWPACYGRALVAQQRGEAAPAEGEPVLIARLAHRVAASVALVLILLMLAIALAQRPRARSAVAMTALLLVLAVALAVLGRWSSAARIPAVTIGNLVGGFVMIALAWQLARAPSSADHGQPTTALRAAFAVAFGALLVQVALGGLVSAGYAGLACPDLRSCGAQATWRALDPFAEPNLAGAGSGNVDGALLQQAHRAGAVLVALLVAPLAVVAWRRGMRGRAATVLALLAVQGALGAALVVYRLPLPLALAHNLASAVLLAACLDLALPSRR
nr:COX15/CtaA family protein [Caldimonas sp.]